MVPYRHKANRYLAVVIFFLYSSPQIYNSLLYKIAVLLKENIVEYLYVKILKEMRNDL